ncbi:MAG: hypothetical protein Q9181_004858 [Wetmoreana brouardii]
MIKGNDLMRDRVEQATHGCSPEGLLSFATVDRAFAASLAMHLLICDWAAEQWRWYANSLEDQFQNTSRRTLTAPVTVPQTPVTAKSEFCMRPRTETSKSSGSILARVSRIPTMLTEKLSMANGKPSSPTQHTYTDPDSGLSQPLPPHIIMNSAPDPIPESAPTKPQPSFEDSEEQDFSFAKLQKIQHIQDKTHEAVLILKLNVSIISQLKQHYIKVTQTRIFPQDVTRLCQDNLEHFELRLTGVLDDLQMQILRLESLSRLLGDRKTLYHNTEINKLSTKNMISMTEDMNDIARKTKIETVSMKVITVVTLFFLPGTFISVCFLLLLVSSSLDSSRQKALAKDWSKMSTDTCSTQKTLMSTDIFQTDGPGHPKPDPYAHLSPLQVYLAASLPLNLITILIWAALHWLEKHKEKLKAQAHKLQSLIMV